MGQATLDLPDPSQLSGINTGPLSPEALASADDLLSQLAGDDIDRLLAEAETERPRPAGPPAPAQPPILAALAPQVTIADTLKSTAEFTPDPTPAEIDAILGPAIDSTLKAVDEEIAVSAPALEVSAAVEIPAAHEIPPSVEIPPAVEVARVEIHSTIEPSPAVDVPQTLESAVPIAAQPDAPASTPAPALQPSDQKILDDAAAHLSAIMDPHAAPPEAAILAPAAIADDAERQALAEPLIIPQPQGKPSFPLRLLVQILQWINAPMRFLSDSLREAIGKIAILTTCNAAAVIVYVMVFRRPHH
jgi:hypothetical protein